MGPLTIADKEFHELIAKRARTLLGLVHYMSQGKDSSSILTRPLVGELLSQSTQLEELLDAYGARGNCPWCGLRSLTAAIKLFSNVSYELLHILHVLPAYQLLSIERDFAKATEETLGFTGAVLLRTANQMLAKADELGISVPSGSVGEGTYSEELPAGRLAHDCMGRTVETVSETVTLLATAFLNLAAESRDVRAAGGAAPDEYTSYVPCSISEESLRSLELRFHNLQSLYDTRVSGTAAEDVDADLAVLRGHVSVVFHLLRTATLFAHYYERHLSKQPCQSHQRQSPPVDPDALLEVLMKYSVTYISLYIDSAEQLCRRMLKHYAEIARVEVGVPQYRGFHVRPATLISKLVLHYGSEVQMHLEQEQYDASSALELFRANEKINARKRRWLAEEIVRLKLVEQNKAGQDVESVVRGVVLVLVQQGKVILYEQPLQLPDEAGPEEGTMLEKVTDRLAELLALGKIDIDTDLKATFVGDKRVLADIKLLAEAGYGEDNFGNNVPLPEKLAYLRR